MKRLLLILTLLTGAAFAQQGNTLMLTGAGAPSGNCAFMFIYTNTSNGDFYNCLNGSWNKVTSVGGGGNVSTTQTNVYGAFLQDFSAATMELPEAAAFVTTVDSTIGVDTNTLIMHIWGPGSADSFNVVTSSTSTTVTQPIFATAIAGLYAPRAIANGDLPAPSFPVTVAGTVTSGGIPCFTSTTVESSSAILNSNILTKGGGAGVCPTNSSITDNGTVVSTLEQIKAGAIGAVGYADNTIGVTTATMSAQSSATCTNITNMMWNIAANKNYVMHCNIPMTFAASATVAFCMGGPGTPTSHSINAVGNLGVAAAYGDLELINSATYGTKTNASGAVGASSQIVLVDAVVRNGATASGVALTLQTAANGTNNITVLADASCSLVQTN